MIKRHDIVDKAVKEDILVWKRLWLSVDALAIAKDNQEELSKLNKAYKKRLDEDMQNCLEEKYIEAQKTAKKNFPVVTDNWGMVIAY